MHHNKLNFNNMNFIVNSELLLEQLTAFSNIASQTTSTTSEIDCFKFETHSTGRLQTITDIARERITSFEMPPIEPYEGPAPSRLVGFNEARCEHEHSGTVHFYINDDLFKCVWNDKNKYVPLLRQYESVIGPDFSQYVDMTYDERYYNAWRNRTLTAEWQSYGINVIPNVTWSLPDSYDYSFSGIPKHSVIAVNCTAIYGHNLTRYLWRKGYEEMMQRLEPRLIIRYGDKMPGENEAISVYFPNERLQRLRRLPRKPRIRKSILISNQSNLFSYGR